MHGFKNTEIRQSAIAPDFKDLGRIAVEMIDKRNKPFAFISGQMRTGDGESYIKKLLEIDQVADSVAAGSCGKDITVFYHLVFQLDIHRIRDASYQDDDAFIRDLCQDFSRPVLQHPLLRKFVQMPDWEKSKGANLELDILCTCRPRTIQIVQVESAVL